MSPNKTLYIRDEDIPVWERAEAHAAGSRRSLSQLVSEALDSFVPVPVPDEEMDEIELVANEATRRFRGKWLVEPNERDRGYEGFDLGSYWGVAITAKGQFAVFSAHCNDRWPAVLEVHRTLAEAIANLPESVSARASEAMGQRYVVNMDI